MSYSRYYNPKQGSRWDRPNKEDGSEVGSKRKLSDEGSSKAPDDEPGIKKAALNTPATGMSFGMGQKNTSKISMNISSDRGAEANPSSAKVAPIKVSLAPGKPKEVAPVLAKPKKLSVAQAFNDDDSSDEEEMPPEAKMRMRNLGKNTPTAAGPNSFGKNRLGFCDRQKVLQRELQKQMDDMSKESE